MTKLEQYQALNLDGSWIGLEQGDEIGDYFCTPVGARVLGWDNGIHYCFLDGFEEMVFCVNPETCCDYYVYPLARTYDDFLSLILSTKNANTIQQIILWDRSEYERFLHDPNTVKWAEHPETVSVLEQIKTKLGVRPMEDPFEYVKAVQKDFPYDKIQFTNEYYDTLGLDRPDGTDPDMESDRECRPADTTACMIEAEFKL